MENRQQQHGVSITGFLLGVLVGVLVTLLFTTKKGRMLLKTLTDEGLNKVSFLEDLLNETNEEDIIEGEQADIAKEKSQSNQTETNGHKKNGSTIGKVKSSARRFFKRTKHN